MAVGEAAAGGRAPLRLDLGKMGLAAHMVVGRDPREDVGVGPEARGVADKDRVTQRVDANR